MYQLKLCETREYSPRILEDWLHSQQKNPQKTKLILKEDDGKVAIFFTQNLETFLEGSHCIQAKITKQKANYHISQKSLLPIKRHAQFEDRTNKTRIFPLNKLIHFLANTPGSFAQIQFNPILLKHGQNAIKKAKQSTFHPQSRFDQWESTAWFSWKARRFCGPLIRRLIRENTTLKQTEEHTQSLHEREDPKQALLDKLSRPLFKVEISLSHPHQEFFQSFNLPYLGQFHLTKRKTKLILSAEELASIIAPPEMESCSAKLHTETSAYYPAPKDPFDFKVTDRQRHLYLLGKTGMGKSTLLRKLIMETEGCQVVIDPHGDLIEDLLIELPNEKIILIDPSEKEFPIALNPLVATVSPTVNL